VNAAEIPVADEASVNGGSEAPAGQWLRDSRGREYIRAEGRRGIIYRQAGETVEDALRRDARPRDERPRRPRPKAPPKPSSVDLKELERLLADVFRAPAVPAAALLTGMDGGWTADHFTNMGPFLARNLVVAAEHNPWLRVRLERAAGGGDLAMQLAAMVPLASAVLLYTVPPLVYWLNLPMPDKGRELFGIPQRKQDAPKPPPTPPAGTPSATAAPPAAA